MELLNAGEEMMQKLNLYPRKVGYWTGYDKDVDPTISNHFAVAASKLSRTAIEVSVICSFTKYTLITFQHNDASHITYYREN